MGQGATRTTFAGRGATRKPSASDVAALIAYDPLCGEFRWKRASANGRTPAGGHAGSVTAAGYRQIGVLGRTHTAANIAWLLSFGEWPAHQIDHINGDPSDTDPFEAHVQRLSASVGFNANRHSERHLEPCSRNRGMSFPE